MLKIFESHPGMYTYTYLPRFATFILKYHLDEFVAEQFRLSKTIKIPILNYLRHFSEEQLLAISKESMIEYLDYLAQNKAKELIEISLQRWLADDLKIISKFEILAEDITLVNYIRSEAMKGLLRRYTTDVDTLFTLQWEIDSFFNGSTTSATNTYIQVLKDKIESESHLSRQLINASPGIIFLFDLIEQKELFVNSKVAEVMGFTVEELLAMGSTVLPRFIHPDDVAILQNHMLEVRADKEDKTYEIEYRFKHADGSYRWLRTYDVVFKRDDAGKPIQVLGQSFDMTKEKEISLALEKREEQLLEAQALAHVGSFEWDMEKDVTVDTPELKKIFEINEPQSYYEFIDRVHPDDREKVQKEMALAFTNGQYECEYRYLAPSGQKVLLARSVVAFQDTKPVYMKGTVQDITSIKKVEQELLQKTLELERSNESLQQFASIASHDLNEPLRKITIFTNFVIAQEGHRLSEQANSYLQKVQASSQRMKQMIDDILTFSTVNKSQHPQRCSLQKVLDDAVESLEEQIREKKAVIQSDSLPEASVIPFQMQQLFQNLLSNSLKFSKDLVPPVITITHECLKQVPLENGLKPADSYLQIKVKDNGIGFDQQYAERIFKLFNRLHGRSDYEGTGIGLAICKRAVENHGGMITAESSEGAGATFTIVLPQ
ncbi:MAG: PAS domain-containing protein [Flavisolibacter sp.]|nr:PAS domain-containing protein [Flavisolibacter sp.]